MYRLILPILISLACTAQAEDRCDLLIGAWQGEFTNLNTGHHIKFISIYNRDFSFKSDFESYSVEGRESKGDPDQGNFEQGGTWECGKSILTKHSTYNESEKHPPITKKYQIISIDHAHLKYQTIQGHTRGKVYEVYRVQ